MDFLGASVRFSPPWPFSFSAITHGTLEGPFRDSLPVPPACRFDDFCFFECIRVSWNTLSSLGSPALLFLPFLFRFPCFLDQGRNVPFLFFWVRARLFFSPPLESAGSRLNVLPLLRHGLLRLVDDFSTFPPVAFSLRLSPPLTSGRTVQVTGTFSPRNLTNSFPLS